MALFYPFLLPPQFIPAIAVIDVIAVVAVVATTDTMPTIAVQQQHPHSEGMPGGTPPGPGGGVTLGGPG